MVKNRLKVFRVMKDLTQEELAELVGVSRQTIIAIEKGKYNPSVYLAIKLARVLDTTVEEIFTIEEEK
ncbi:MAG TPA: transcriptional regulator [candidate division WOR-3 bacterium]|uniref:Transcriptional regulator n=1 Tax=candidate division WOR-3 bacterium TaxID=2052148 RepID=A0A7C0ZLK8_UNCW3|nr:transcriptional regulator [candidate division WOR-3 bacterium]